MTIGSQNELQAQCVVELFVADLQKSIAFYQAIGFDIERSDQSFAVMRWQNAFLFQDERSTQTIKNITAFEITANVRIIVDDINHHWQKMQTLNLPIALPLATKTMA